MIYRTCRNARFTLISAGGFTRKPVRKRDGCRVRLRTRWQDHGGDHLPGRTIYDWRHYLAVIQRKPGALRNGAPFSEMPDAFRQLQTLLLRRAGGDREVAEILALVLHHDEKAVLCAVEMALEAGIPTRTHVLNLLHRLLDSKAPTVPPVNAPQALLLTKEPQADVERYDTLRVKGMRHAS